MQEAHCEWGYGVANLHNTTAGTGRNETTIAGEVREGWPWASPLNEIAKSGGVGRVQVYCRLS